MIHLVLILASLSVGDTFGGWTIEALSPAVDDAGAPTEAACEFAHNATVAKDSERRTARLEVHCNEDGTPAEPLLILGSVVAEVPAEPATQPAAEPAASQPAASQPAASQPAAEVPDPPEEELHEHEDDDEHLEPLGFPHAHLPGHKGPHIKPPFLKGELTNFGTVQLLTHENAVAVALGVSQIDEKFFLLARPEAHLSLDKFSLGVAVPLRFEVIDLGAIGRGESVVGNAGAFRVEDWDQIEDFLKPLRYLTWGHKEDKLYVDLNRIHAITLGHGQLMRRYSPTMDIDEDNLFAELDAYFDLGGVELMAGPFPIPRLAGGMVFLKPLGFIDTVPTKSFSVGLTYLTDINVPDELVHVQNPADGRTQIPVLDDNELLFEGLEEIAGHRVQGFGVDSEIKVYRDDHYDLKLYGDWSTLVFPASSEAELEAFTASGLTFGALLRTSFGAKKLETEHAHSERGKKRADAREHGDDDGHDLHHINRGEAEHLVPQHALRLRVEARVFDAGYLPSYFDSFYEADKLQFELGGTDPLSRANLPTKWAYMHGLKDNPRRIGGYLELSYLLPGWFGASLSYEDAFSTDFTEAKAARNLALHFETNHTEWIKAFVTYHFRHFDDVTKLFQFNTDNQVLYLGAKAKLLPFLFVHVAAQRTFKVGFIPDDLEFQKRPLDPDNPEEQFRFTSVGFETEWATDVQVELGWEF